jgi:hypothetical protein
MSLLAGFTDFNSGNPIIMSPLFLVNWHRVHGHFRTLMWLLALALAALILLHSVPAPQAQPGQMPRSGLQSPSVAAAAAAPASADRRVTRR